MGNGYVREFHHAFSFGNTVAATPDTLIPKYFETRTGILAIDGSGPSGTLESWVPDTVWASSDTIWISTTIRACDDLSEDGLAGWLHAESLDVFKRPCPSDPGEPVRHLFHYSPRVGVWYVSTLQPFGYTWEMP